MMTALGPRGTPVGHVLILKEWPGLRATRTRRGTGGKVTGSSLGAPLSEWTMGAPTGDN